MPALGVGVKNLDSEARHRRHDIARPLRAAARHVLDKTDDADGIDLRLSLGELMHQADDAAAPAMSPFMSSMPAAGLSEMPPVSKVTPLPTKTMGSPPLAPTPFHCITTT